MSRPPSLPIFALVPCIALATSWLAGCARDSGSPPARTLASGLRIQETVAGSGDPAAEGEWVEVHYEARVVDTHEEARGADARAYFAAPFDSTHGGEPFTFRIGRSKVLAAFTEGVTGMREGGRRKLTLPPALAYGALGKGAIPPDATLAYDVELVHRFTRSKLGVDYVERKRGAGPKPVVGQSVIVRCRAWLVESGRSILDAKRARDGYVVEIGAGHAIPALERVLPEMNVGSLWRLGVPPELGYGSAGHLPILVAGQDLLLDLELVSILDKP